MQPCDLCGSRAASVVLELPAGAYVRCPECGFVFTQPGDTPAEDFNHEFFEKALQRYVATNYSPRTQRTNRLIIVRSHAAA